MGVFLLTDVIYVTYMIAAAYKEWTVCVKSNFKTNWKKNKKEHQTFAGSIKWSQSEQIPFQFKLAKCGISFGCLYMEWTVCVCIYIYIYGTQTTTETLDFKYQCLSFWWLYLGEVDLHQPF